MFTVTVGKAEGLTCAVRDHVTSPSLFLFHAGHGPSLCHRHNVAGEKPLKMRKKKSTEMGFKNLVRICGQLNHTYFSLFGI